MDPNATLLKGQNPSTVAEMVKTSDEPYREGIGPHTNAPKPDPILSIAIDANSLKNILKFP